MENVFFKVRSDDGCDDATRITTTTTTTDYEDARKWQWHFCRGLGRGAVELAAFGILYQLVHTMSEGWVVRSQADLLDLLRFRRKADPGERLVQPLHIHLAHTEQHRQEQLVVQYALRRHQCLDDGRLERLQ